MLVVVRFLSHRKPMGAKIAAFLISVVLVIAIAVLGLFFLLIALNGYSESDVTYGFAAFGILSFLAALVSGAIAAAIAHLMTRREFKAFGSILAGVATAFVFGVVAIVVTSGLAVGITEYARNNF